MRIRIQPYRAGSRSARALSEATGIRRVRLVRTRFQPREDDLVINWGSSTELFPESSYLNKPAAVGYASNKLYSLYKMAAAEVSIPPWTESRDTALNWLDNDRTVLARTLLRATSGRGIVVVEPGQELPNAPLYTQYVPKYDEYRVHVFNGEVIDVQQKRRRNGEEADSRVRNARNGWVFCRQEVEPPPVVMEQAVRSVRALGLDFGAADIGYTRRGGIATVYEVNTAPGLEGSTVNKYASAIRAI